MLQWGRCANHFACSQGFKICVSRPPKSSKHADSHNSHARASLRRGRSPRVLMDANSPSSRTTWLLPPRREAGVATSVRLRPGSQHRQECGRGRGVGLEPRWSACSAASNLLCLHHDRLQAAQPDSASGALRPGPQDRPKAASKKGRAQASSAASSVLPRPCCDCRNWSSYRSSLSSCLLYSLPTPVRRSNRDRFVGLMASPAQIDRRDEQGLRCAGHAGSTRTPAAAAVAAGGLSRAARHRSDPL